MDLLDYEFRSASDVNASKRAVKQSNDLKSNMKVKGILSNLKEMKEMKENDMKNDKSKSVRWKEGTDLEDVLFIPPREHIMSVLSQQFPLNDIDGEEEYYTPINPLQRANTASSNTDITTFLHNSRKYISLSSDPKSSDLGATDDQDQIINKHSDDGHQISQRSDVSEPEIEVVKFATNIQSDSDYSDSLITGSPKGEKIVALGRTSNDPEASNGTPIIQGKATATIAEEALRVAEEQMKDTEKRPTKATGKQRKGTRKDKLSTVPTGRRIKSPPLKVIKSAATKPFVKPTLRYVDPPFTYDLDVTSSIWDMQESCSGSETEIFRNRSRKSKYTKGKLYIQYAEDTDYNFICLNELYKEVFKSIKFGKKLPSEKTIGSMINDLETEFKPAVLDAPYGFNPDDEMEWMDLGVNLSTVKYKNVREENITFPLTDLNFTELIMTGDTIGPLENYMIVNENFVMDMEYSPLDEMIPSDVDTNFNPQNISPPKIEDATKKLKVLTGNPYRFPKLIVPDHIPHPVVNRLRQTNVHVVMQRKTHSVPSSPPPEVKPVLKDPVQVQTIYATKQNSDKLPVQVQTQPHKESIVKPRRFMLAKSLAKTELYTSSENFATDVSNRASSNQSQSIETGAIPVMKYQPRPGDYMTFMKSSHWNPIPQLVTKQTKMSLFKQILTEEEARTNTYAMANVQVQDSGVLYSESPTLYTDLMEHSNVIVLTKNDVLELIAEEPEVPQYFTSTLHPGVYVPVTRLSSPPPNKEKLKCKERAVLNLPQLQELRSL